MLLYLVTHKDKEDWVKEKYIAWMGMEYRIGSRAWNDGITDLTMNEFIVVKDGEIRLVKK